MNPSEMQRKGPPQRWCLQVYPTAPKRQRPSRTGHDDDGGFVEKKRGKCGEKQERSDCYCVCVERSRHRRLHFVLY
uniref:Endogenous retrovirus group K member 5 Np9 protein n=1 Tax=Homo sapiens TaxID=9606 RepID=NP5_HUMAN|nr:RecName: Full=Endogenous retrovirus group K member 5 Np9 protein; AltName: Full=Endogenous retrovirus K protein 5; AltName: Full=HERV-K(II) Np9 protein; AltName: Full=HERV-K_3q12.3 provirus Np9 protein [Homo sapiens]